MKPPAGVHLAFPKPYQKEGRERLTESQKRLQLERHIREQNNLCWYCKRPMNRIPDDMRCATRDHIVPQPAGCFKDDRDINIVAACWECNCVKKGSRRE